MKAVKRKWEAEYGPIEVTVIVTYKIDLSREVSFHIYIPDYVNAPIEEVTTAARNRSLDVQKQSPSWTIITSKIPNEKTARNEISRIHSILRPIRRAGREHERAWNSLSAKLNKIPSNIEESGVTYKEVTNGPEEETV